MAIVLRWFILRHRPQLVIVSSRFASRYAEEIARGHGISCLSTPNPVSQWWNRKARRYGNRTGRELFHRFLKEQHWQARNLCPPPRRRLCGAASGVVDVVVRAPA